MASVKRNSAIGSVATSGSAPYKEASHEASHGASQPARQAGRQVGMEPGTAVVVGAMRHRSKKFIYI